MRIKQTGFKKGILEKTNLAIKPSRRMRTAILSIFGSMLIFAVITGSILFGMVLHKEGQAYTLNSIFKAKLHIIPNYFKGLTSNPERININIKHEDYQKLAYKRKIARAKGILITGSDDYVPAVIGYEGKEVKAKIRLKGDIIDHLVGNKWSFRIRIRGGDTLFGMERFSIQHPKTRNYIYEWIILRALKREEILAPRYEFIRVSLNGKDLGIYALEEHFEKRLIEDNGHREGVIIKFNENSFWEESLSPKSAKDKMTALQLELTADINTFKKNAVLKDPVLFNQFILGKNLLESFRNGDLPTHKVFNIGKLAKYYAISELMGGLHGIVWHNYRFYYNPISSLLEPIGFDAMAGRDLKEMLDEKSLVIIKDPPDVLHSKIFSDMIFFEEYIKELEKVSRKSYINELFEDISEDLQKNLNIIHSECPYFIFSKNIFYQNQEHIRAILNPLKGFNAYFRGQNKNVIELALGNIQSMPIEVMGVSCGDAVLFAPKKKTILTPMDPAKPVKYSVIKFLFPKEFTWRDKMREDLRVKYRLLGASDKKFRSVFPYSTLSDGFIENDFIRQSPNAHEFKFLSINNSTKKIFIRSGNWHIQENMIIPKGYELICKEDTRLTLTNSAKILSYSPLKFIGSEKYPIFICSDDSTGQGVVVINAGTKSILQNVVFQNLTNPEQNGWELTGAVTFYESPVDIRNCRFLNSRAEDALNIVRSDFLIDETFFSKTFSDAFDSDFSKGTITNSFFKECGNDAVDISGSIVELRNISINGAGDKGLSVGEKSTMTVNYVEIENAKTAVASKDLSEIYGNDIVISDCDTGFALYQKKPEFGASTITVSEVTMNMVNTPYLIKDGSELRIDQKLINARGMVQ